MGDRRNRRTHSLTRLGGVVLLAVLSAASAHAQNDALAPTVPLSPGLAPSLTDDPQTAPVTTLSTDLLAPQRAFIFDPSGASVSANSLNPEIYSSSFSLSAVETDTQIRDSSQTGWISPYAAGTQRLGLDFSGGGASAGQGNSLSTNGSFRPTYNAGNDTGQPGMESAFQSSWGADSSFSSQSEGNSWGTRRLTVDRMGHKQQDSLTATRGANSELAVESDSTGNIMGSFASRTGSARTNPSAYGSRSGHPRATSARNPTGQAMIGNQTSSGTVYPPGGGAPNAASAEPSDSAKYTLSYFPPADYGPSPLGESPFSSPTGVGELHFLNPNIYAATSQGHPEKGGATETSLRRAFSQRDRLAASSSHYGLITHPGAEGSAQGNDDKSRLKKDSHLRTSIFDTESP